jgi:dihydrofolate reductase
MVTIIAAVGRNKALGKNNDLIWHLPADLKRFKEITRGHHVIMGRKTYESLGKPLPNRTNIIVSRNPGFKAEGCVVVGSLDEALREAESDPNPYILGGAQIYEQALQVADRMDLTLVHEDFEADAFFPDFSEDHWEETGRQDFEKDEKNPYDYSFVQYKKK